MHFFSWASITRIKALCPPTQFSLDAGDKSLKRLYGWNKPLVIIVSQGLETITLQFMFSGSPVLLFFFENLIYSTVFHKSCCGLLVQFGYLDDFISVLRGYSGECFL